VPNPGRDSGGVAPSSGQPIVTAIEKFVEENGRPPLRVDDLVPRWLERLPARLPPLRIEAASSARDRLFGNPWILIASTPIGMLNWDEFCYFPLQNYPQRDSSGTYQRLGRWAYLHE
jgi:hypothetical protein